MFIRTFPLFVITIFFFFTIIVISGQISGIRLLESYSKIATEEQLDKLIKLVNFIIEILEHLLPMAFSALFGMLGAFAKNLIDQGHQELAKQSFINVINQSNSKIKEKLTKNEEYLFEYEASIKFHKLNQKNNLRA